jgi:hypothetical protein
LSALGFCPEPKPSFQRPMEVIPEATQQKVKTPF